MLNCSLFVVEPVINALPNTLVVWCTAHYCYLMLSLSATEQRRKEESRCLSLQQFNCNSYYLQVRARSCCCIQCQKSGTAFFITKLLPKCTTNLQLQSHIFLLPLQLLIGLDQEMKREEVATQLGRTRGERINNDKKRGIESLIYTFLHKMVK